MRWWRVALTTALVSAVGAGTAQWATASSANPPSLHMTRGPYHEGETINLSVGANRYFKPYSRIIIIECADPGGKKGALPVNVDTCDGNTVQSNSVLVNTNGSFSDTTYTMYVLPNETELGETPDDRPICNAKHDCVLYVGEDQENFTWPKIWSHPFTIESANKHRRGNGKK